MSALLYLYRVSHEDLWPWLDQVRAHYRERSPIARLACELAGQVIAEPDEDRRQDMVMGWYRMEADHRDTLEQLTVDVQLFDDGDGMWIVRAVERFRGAAFDAMIGQHPDWPVQRMYYNSHTDMPDGMAELTPLVDRLDEMIRAGRYVTSPIVSLHDADELLDAALAPLRESRRR